MSRSTRMLNVTVDGIPGGCLKRLNGSGCSQYSSSHSAGKSRSNLDGRSNQVLNEKGYSLFLPDNGTSTSGSAHPSIENYKHPEKCSSVPMAWYEKNVNLPPESFPELSLHCQRFAHFPSMSTTILRQSYGHTKQCPGLVRRVDRIMIYNPKLTELRMSESSHPSYRLTT
jgi:hypothetical protein